MKKQWIVWTWVIMMGAAFWACAGRPQVDHEVEKERCTELFQQAFLTQGQLVLSGDFSASGLLGEEGLCYKGLVLFPDTLALCAIKGVWNGDDWTYEALSPRPFFEQEAILPLACFDVEEAVIALRTYLQETSCRIKVMDELRVNDFRVCMLHKFGYGDAADAYLISLPDGKAALCVTHAPKGPLFMESFYDFARQEITGMEAIGQSKVSIMEITDGNNALRPTCQPTP